MDVDDMLYEEVLAIERSSEQRKAREAAEDRANRQRPLDRASEEGRKPYPGSVGLHHRGSWVKREPQSNQFTSQPKPPVTGLLFCHAMLELPGDESVKFEQEITVIDYLLGRQQWDVRPRQLPLATSRGGQDGLSSDAMFRLASPDAAITDSVVNKFCRLFAENTPQSFFLSKRSNAPNRVIKVFPSHVLDWTRRKSGDFDELARLVGEPTRINGKKMYDMHGCWNYAMWLLPMHLPDDRWILAVVDLVSRKLIVYDSDVKDAPWKGYIQWVAWTVESIAHFTPDRPARKWAGWDCWTAHRAEVTQQWSSYESGLWTLAHALALCRGFRRSGQIDMLAWRKRLYFEAWKLPVIVPTPVVEIVELVKKEGYMS